MSLYIRELVEQREELKQTILDSFLEEFPQYEDMTDTFEDIRFEEEEIESWKEVFIEELKTIEAINDLEEDVDKYGGDYFEETYLIVEEDFEDYCKELVDDCYNLSEVPDFIKNNIDWEGVAEDLKVDYTEVEFRGTTYLFR